RANAHAIRSDPETDATARQFVFGEETVERLTKSGNVADFAGDDDAGSKRRSRQLEKPSAVVVHHPRGRDLRRADLEPDELLLLRPLGLRRRLGFARTLLFRRALEELGELDLLVQVHP